MDLSIFKIGGWNFLQFRNRKLLEESFEKAAIVALLKGIVFVRWCNVTGDSTTSKRTFIVMRLCEDEIHEHSDEIFKDAIGTE